MTLPFEPDEQLERMIVNADAMHRELVSESPEEVREAGAAGRRELDFYRARPVDVDGWDEGSMFGTTPMSPQPYSSLLNDVVRYGRELAEEIYEAREGFVKELRLRLPGSPESAAAGG